MKKVILQSVFLTLGLLVIGQAWGQKNIFKGIFEKEEVTFNATVAATYQSGVAMLVFDFSHSKISTLETIIWVKDQGTNLLGNGQKKKVRGLSRINNGQKDTVFIEDLSNLHFYTIGIDYRNPKTISRKYNSKVLKEGFHYEFKTKPPSPKAKAPIARRPTPKPKVNPCRTPVISTTLESSGYCGVENRPAVLIECKNCHGTNWEFAVEVRTGAGSWKFLRSDGKTQSAFGSAVRTEPLCTLTPGLHYIRVLAWGQGCKTPVIQTANAPIVIGEQKRQQTTIAKKKEWENTPILPDTCIVRGQAYLDRDILRGTLELVANSPCAELNPTARVRYVHPGYRDITLKPIPLTAGSIVPFEVKLDDMDLGRGIHTIQVISEIRQEDMGGAVTIGSFWVKARVEEPSEESATFYEEPIANNGFQAEIEMDPTPPGEEIQTKGFQEPEKAVRPLEVPNEKEPANTKEQEFESSVWEEDIETVNVTASDPNCTQIQDLELVFDSEQRKPLFISWLSPRCCQEEGCKYSVWAGKAPKQLRLLVSGRKPGATVSELLRGLTPEDKYIEVVVKTNNSTRKAAYVLGEGPKYGFEEILEYHDRVYPPKSDTLTFVKTKPTAYQKPTFPIEKFAACKYPRKTSIIGDKPINYGDEVKIKYDYSEKGYQYTLYHLPKEGKEWVVAPGTKDLQSKPNFVLNAEDQFSGKYLILAFKPSKNWGCLSASIKDPIELEVE